MNINCFGRGQNQAREKSANKNTKNTWLDDAAQPHFIPLKTTRIRAQLSPGRAFFAANEQRAWV